jgi:hypothetical protein
VRPAALASPRFDGNPLCDIAANAPFCTGAPLPSTGGPGGPAGGGPNGLGTLPGGGPGGLPGGGPGGAVPGANATVSAPGSGSKVEEPLVQARGSWERLESGTPVTTFAVAIVFSGLQIYQLLESGCCEIL